MNGRVSKHLRKEFRKHWKFDVDNFINDMIDLSIDWRLKVCYLILFKRRQKVGPNGHPT